YARVAWWKTDVGRGYMALAASETAVLILGTAANLLGHDQIWWYAFRVLIFTTIPVVFAWRIVQFRRHQREQTPIIAPEMDEGVRRSSVGTPLHPEDGHGQH